jgi:hypothetical protein
MRGVLVPDSHRHRPSPESALDDDQLAQVIGVVTGHEQHLPQDYLPLPVGERCM